MRRLLVWKQRMLQSPLTRKTSSGSARQSLMPSKIENNHVQKKFLNKDENSDESLNLPSRVGSSQNMESYSEKIQHRKKSHAKENPKFQYNSLSSDEDGLFYDILFFI